MAMTPSPKRSPVRPILGMIALLAVVTTVFFFMRGPKRGNGSLPEPGSPEYKKALVAFFKGTVGLKASYPGAPEFLKTVTQIAPGEPAAWANLAVVAMRINQLPEAAKHLEKALSLAPKDPHVLLLQGILLDRQGKSAEAIATLKRSLDHDPDNLKTRYQLVGMLEQQGAEGKNEVRSQFEEILKRDPDNLEVLLQFVRFAATARDSALLEQWIPKLDKLSAGWPAQTQPYWKQFKEAVRTQESQAPLRIAQLRNVLATYPTFQYSRAHVDMNKQGIPPIEKPIALVVPPPLPAAPDTGLSFAEELLPRTGASAWTGAYYLSADAPPAILTFGNNSIRMPGGDTLPFPGAATVQKPSPSGIATIDWNSDFKPDLAFAGAGGLRLYEQGDKGTFSDVTARAKLPEDVIRGACYGVWPADIEMDGDMDLVVAPVKGVPFVLVNKGDGTFGLSRPFTGVSGVRGFVWADIDGEGVPDITFIDAQGRLMFFTNQRSGQFALRAVPAEVGKIVAVTAGDVDRDAALDLLALRADGTLLRLSDKNQGTAWDMAEIGKWEGIGPKGTDTHCGLFIGDLDNNGAMDIVASGPNGGKVWLTDTEGKLQPLGASISAPPVAIADLSGQGRLDLVTLSPKGPVRLVNKGTRTYHWHALRFRATESEKVLKDTGEGLMNTFGVGGEVEIRSGLLYQKYPITNVVTHVGLGENEEIDVARILWPDGGWQGEFDFKPDTIVVAVHRLVVSCPFLFAWNGKEMAFVTDCIWRSPLGLKINAQETLGVQQTEDWVKIRGDQLQPRDGYYDLRISSELQETQFFDKVELMAVDHPVDTDIFVDERLAVPQPPLAVHVTTPVQPIVRAVDDRGKDVTEIVKARDGKYLNSFGLGRYQGVTRDHWVEVEIPPSAPKGGPLYLIANGWIYPTNTSVNVAMSQGNHPHPDGLRIEVPDGKGGWRKAKTGLGFPTGKVKTVVLDISQVFLPGTPRILRLGTNLEIYWNAIGWVSGRPQAQIRQQRVKAESAELKYRGFSQMSAPGRTAPEVPVSYDNLAGTAQIRRSLIGYYTRYGDIRELTTKVDDRYVIMNAGDEMLFRFPALPTPAPDFKRDYVLIGDGWCKDANYNTTFSKTVLPLPTHASGDYTRPPRSLADDPVYQKHKRDWEVYHTRYQTLREFQEMVKP